MCSTADLRGHISCRNDDDDDDEEEEEEEEEEEVDDDNEEEGGKEEGEREAPPRCSFSYVRVARRKHRQREYHIERAPLACLQVPERGLLSRALHGDVWNRRRRGVNAGNPGESPLRRDNELLLTGIKRANPAPPGHTFVLTGSRKAFLPNS